MQHSATDGSGTNWTSWEGHNFVLKGYVEELISLGARPQLKQVTLQLWAKYLSKLEIAFTSKTKHLLPKFGIHQNAKDYAIIQDHIKRKKRNLKTMLKSQPSTSESHKHKLPNDKKLRIAARVFLDVDYDLIEAELASSRDSLKEINLRMKIINTSNKAHNLGKIRPETSETLTDHHIKFNVRARAAILKMMEMTKSNSSNAATACYQMKHSFCFDPMVLTKQMVLAVLCLSVFFSKDTIQISDIIRWIKEGHLSYFGQARLLPEGLRLTASDTMFIEKQHHLRYKSLQRCVFHISNMLGVERFPAPDLVALARRFLAELRLPAEMGEHVERLMGATQVQRCVGMMSYEAVVMAYIIVVLKTLLGLDGHTEHSISEFAAQINGLMDNVDEDHSGPRLFVWDDWVRYIEWRKSVLVQKHVRSRLHIETDLTTSVGPYAHYCTQEQIQNQVAAGKLIRRSKVYTSGKKHDSIADAITQLPTWKKIKRGYDFPPSLTPQVSYLEKILSYKGASKGISGSHPNMDILTFDQTATTLEFLIQPKKIREFASSRGVDVVIVKSPVHQDLEYRCTNMFKSLRLPSGHKICIKINDSVSQQSSDDMSGKTAKKRKTYNRTNDVRSLKRKKKRKEKENGPTSILNDSINRNAHHNHTSEVEYSSEHEQIEDGKRTVPSSECSTLTLHIPFSAYWVYEIGPRQPEKSFEDTIEPDMPDSFRWLLRECTRILEMETLDLYRVLRQVEKLCSGDAESTILQLRYRVRNQWRDKVPVI